MLTHTCFVTVVLQGQFEQLRIPMVDHSSPSLHLSHCPGLVLLYVLALLSHHHHVFFLLLLFNSVVTTVFMIGISITSVAPFIVISIRYPPTSLRFMFHGAWICVAVLVASPVRWDEGENMRLSGHREPRADIWLNTAAWREEKRRLRVEGRRACERQKHRIQWACGMAQKARRLGELCGYLFWFLMFFYFSEAVVRIFAV